VSNDEIENMILDCYRLAKHYGQSPEHFLAMPVSEVRLHLYRTIQLAKLQRSNEDE
jgi:hypothetical protein